MNNSHTILLVFILWFFCFSPGMAQSASPGVTDSMSNDGSFRYGRLPNGFTYYVKALTAPPTKLDVNFFVKAGVHQQDEDQLNISHAVEHLAFGPTENFPKGIFNDVELLNELEMSNRDFGGNAGFDRTLYSVDVPAENLQALNNVFTWFKDIATGLEFLDEDIDDERGVLRQEFVYGASGKYNEYYAHTRLESRMFPCRADYTNFLEHNKTFSPEILRRFYRDWYRPDLMAVSIVGSMEDPDQMVERIEEVFSDIVPHQNPREAPNCDSLYYQRPAQFVVQELLTDKFTNENRQEVEVRLFYRQPEIQEKFNRPEGIENLLGFRLFIQILEDRLKELEENYNQFYRIGASDVRKYGGLPLSLKISISAGNDSEKQALQETSEVLHQIRKYGATKEEWDETKRAWIKSLEDKNLSSPNYWSEQIEKHFVDGEVLLAGEQDHLKEWLNETSLTEFNKLIKQFLPRTPDDIGIIAPTGHKVLHYSEKEVRSWINGAFKKQVSPYVPPQVPLEVMALEQRSGLKKKDVVDRQIAGFGAEELSLENGVKVVLMPYKPSPGLQENTIMLHGFRKQGASMYPEKKFFSAYNAPSIVRNAGIGGMDKFQLGRFLNSTNGLQVVPYIVYEESGIHGKAGQANLEHLFQLIYLYFVSPQKSEEAFEDWKKIKVENYENSRGGVVAADFDNAIRDLTQNKFLTPVFGRRTLKGTKAFSSVEQTEFTTAYNIYLDLFGNPGEFTFIVSGNFDKDAVRPLIQKYLGNLPERHTLSSGKETQEASNRLPEGPQFFRVPIPYYEIKSTNYALYFVRKEGKSPSWRERMKVEILAEMTSLKSRELRFDKGFSLYNFGVRGGFNRDLNRNEIILRTEAQPEEFPLIRQASYEMIADFKAGNISMDIYDQAVNKVLQTYGRSSMEKHYNMQERLYAYYRYDEPWLDPEEIEKFIESLRYKDIIETARAFYQDQYMYEFVMGEDING